MIRLKVFWDMSNALTTPFKSFWTRTIEPDSIATSVPLPIAIPTVALVKAGASLIPSPTKATGPPCSSART
ncbi:hypothetical protein predicted by Glimmer/Critica [Limosilactobacillus fermentum]|nr:hypothetical protein predicted by Glimmer/Critica [Limosilactobacillus fermentum]